jgi:hypothetical protein
MHQPQVRRQVELMHAKAMRLPGRTQPERAAVLVESHPHAGVDRPRQVRDQVFVVRPRDRVRACRTNHRSPVPTRRACVLPDLSFTLYASGDSAEVVGRSNESGESELLG